MEKKFNIHMGELVRKRVDELGLKHAALAAQINIAPQTLSHVFKRQLIDSELLIRLCQALNKNFFMEYAYLVDKANSLPNNTNEPVEEYTKNLLENKEKVVIELTNGKVSKVEHLQENEYTKSILL